MSAMVSNMSKVLKPIRISYSIGIDIKSGRVPDKKNQKTKTI